MSRNVPAGLVAHVAGETTSLSVWIRITRADGQTFGFTGHDRDLLIDGILHEAAFALGLSQLQASDDYSVDNAEADGAIDSVRITEADIRAGRWDGFTWIAGLVNWQSPSLGTIELARGAAGEITRTRRAFKVELLTLGAALQNTIGRLITPTCPFVLGSAVAKADCRKDLAAFTVGGVAVTAVADRRNFTAAGLAQAAGYFNFGKLTWSSGLNAALTMEIDTHTTGGVLKLALPMPFAVAIGDQFTIVAGCDKKFATCRDKFANTPNFGGMPYLPGLDKIIQVGRHDTP